MNDVVLKLSNITKIYRSGKLEVNALRDVSFEIKKGEFVAILGPSGCGKSTLMNILGCLDKQTSGEYLFQGTDTGSLGEDELAEIRGKQIGFVFQAFNLLPRINIMRNIELPLIYNGIDLEERIKRIHDVLKKIGLLDRLYHTRVELSGGEQQKVAIARAMVMHPDMILADEPTGNLDTKSSDDIMSLFKKLNEEGVTVILITHESDVAKQTKRTITLRDGKLVADVDITIFKEAPQA